MRIKGLSEPMNDAGVVFGGRLVYSINFGSIKVRYNVAFEFNGQSICGWR